MKASFLGRTRGWLALGALLAGCGENSVVGGPVDTGVADAGLVDTGPVDTGPLVDLQPNDQGPPDTGAVDVVTMDAFDAGPADTGTPDAGPADTGPSDTGPTRCTTATDCVGDSRGPACDTTSGACVACTPTDDRCPAGQYCTSGNACSAGCRDDAACTTGDAGTGNARCNPTTRQCVACVTDDHCAAGTLCVGNLCVAGCNSSRPCAAGQTCCDGACVDTQSNVATCGACGTRCMAANAVPACTNGTCTVGMCTAPFANCDSMASNGCETNTQTDTAHCGGCNMACAARANATASCAAGVCQYACAAGFADCDGNAANGCEVDTRTSTTHCGACNRGCNPPNGAAVCTDGQCSVGACSPNFGNCDGNATNGCEADTRTSVTHCGACGTACASAPNAGPICVGSTCALICVAGFSDCDSNATNGCEADTRVSVTHCGGCGRTCTAANATAACNAGACAIASCAAGFGNCDNNVANGCEIDTLSNNAHCGGCGMACGSNQRCTAGVCLTLSRCAELLAQNPSLPSGTYTLDLDGAGPNPARPYYCDMRDGGWTMVANQPANTPLPDVTTTVNAAGFGDLAQAWRLGGAEITALVPGRAWRLTDNANTVYFRPTCVVDWAINYTDIMEARPCTTGYTSTAFNTIVNGRWVYCSARGIGVNNSGQSCSMRMHEGGPANQGAMAHGRAATCAYRIDERVSLWIQ